MKYNFDFDSMYKKIDKIYVRNKPLYSEETDNIRDTFKEVIKDFEKDIWKYEKKSLDISKNPSFYERNEFIWGEVFFLLEKFEFYLSEMAMYYDESYISKISEEEYKKIEKYCFCFKAITLRTIVIYRSIICLLKNGFVDSALALWRSLFELEVIANVLEKEPIEGSEALYNYLDIITDENNYNWCKSISCFMSNKKNISFTDLVDFVDIKRDGSDSRYNEYKNACNVLHIAKRNLLCTTGDYTGIDIQGKYVLQSSQGIDIVANHISVSMMKIYFSYFKYFNNVNDNFLILNMFLCGLRDNIQDKINDAVNCKIKTMVYQEI